MLPNQASAVSGLAFLLCLICMPANAQEVDIDPQPGDVVYFARNSSRLSMQGEETLRRQAAWLKDHPAVTCALEGHTDEWGSRKLNIDLGQKRAVAVRQFLIGLGIAPHRLSTVSYGEDRPRALCKMEQCWSHNRRVTTIVTGGFDTQ